MTLPLPEEVEPQPTLASALHAGNVVQDPTHTAGVARTVQRVVTVHVVVFEELAGHPDRLAVPMGTRVAARGVRRRQRPVLVDLDPAGLEEDDRLAALDAHYSRLDERRAGHGR